MQFTKAIEGVTHCGNCNAVMIAQSGKFCTDCGPYERIMEDCQVQSKMIIARAEDATLKLQALKDARAKAIDYAAIRN